MIRMLQSLLLGGVVYRAGELIESPSEQLLAFADPSRPAPSGRIAEIVDPSELEAETAPPTRQIVLCARCRAPVEAGPEAEAAAPTEATDPTADPKRRSRRQ